MKKDSLSMEEPHGMWMKAKKIPVMIRYGMIIKGMPEQLCWEFTESMVCHKTVQQNTVHPQ